MGENEQVHLSLAPAVVDVKAGSKGKERFRRPLRGARDSPARSLAVATFANRFT